MNFVKLKKEHLDFTLRAENYMQDLELKMTTGLEWDLFNKGQLNVDEILWYQAYKGFKWLSEFPRKNENLASELRRYIFITKLGGTEITHSDKNIFKLKSGEEYDSLRKEALIEKMVDALNTGLYDQEIFEDIKSNAEKFTLTTNNRKRLKEDLLKGKIERRPLIRYCFALKMHLEKFNQFLSNAAFMRTLSPAVPEDLIIMYCIENNLKWSKVISLQEKAIEYLNENKSTNVEPEFTSVTPQLDVSENKFVNEILRNCCREAFAKKNFESMQYSETARDIFIENSILKELVPIDHTNQFLPLGYSTVYLSDTVLRYFDNLKEFKIGEEYDLDNIRPNIVLSQKMYWRFLNYRITKGNGTTTFSMKFGSLLQEIAKNILKYYKLNQFELYSHRITRYDILTVIFYRYLLELWQNKNSSFVVKNEQAPNKLWLEFFKIANENLEDAGYEKITNKNPFDAVLRIVMHSMIPLECFARIYELNVMSSFFSRKDDTSSDIYILRLCV